MEVNIKDMIDKIMYETCVNFLAENEKFKQENKKLKADNIELATSFKQLIADQQEALDYIDDLEEKLSKDSCCDERARCGCETSCCEDKTIEFAPAIRSIHYCDEPGKEKTIVIFADGSKVIKELVAGDKFDLNVGVALCVAERMYGGKTPYHKMVKKIAGIKEKRNKIVTEEAKDKSTEALKKISKKK